MPNHTDVYKEEIDGIKQCEEILQNIQTAFYRFKKAS